MSIDEKLKNIKSYIVSIRYQEELSIVDVKLNDGWKVPQSKIIGIKEYPSHPNTYMFYSDKENIGIDEILSYIEDVVVINIEREKKISLLGEKIKELKTFFIQHSLKDLEMLRFEIGEDEEEPLDVFSNKKLISLDEDGMEENDIPFEEEVMGEETMENEIIEEESN